jgi:glycosyltransferase involved in cell wall biosynthesis
MMLERLLCRMKNNSFSNQVVSLTDIGVVGRRIMDRGVRVHALCMPNGRLTLGGLVKLWQLLRLIRPTILQTWLYHADLLGLIFGKLAGISSICWNIRCSHIDLSQYRPTTRWTIRLCSLLSALPDAVITNSRAAVKFHSALGYKAKHWQVIPNGFDLERFKPDQSAKERLLSELDFVNRFRPKRIDEGNGERHRHDTLLIGLIARYDPMKDHSNFLKAASLLLQERRDVDFILAGKGVEWANQRLVTEIPNDLGSHFCLLGERNDTESLAASLDIATSASYGEGFSNTIGEAMACGLPCVVTDVGDSAAIVGNTGLVVPAKDPKALAMAWKELIDLGEDGRRNLGAAARKRIEEHFDLSRAVEEYEGLYSSLLGTSGEPSHS